jgi:hypothetical protein
MPRPASRSSFAASCSPCWAPPSRRRWRSGSRRSPRAATCSTRSRCDPGVTTTVRCATGSG